MSEYTILGAGMAGYGAAYYLSSKKIVADLYDKNDYFGGHTNSCVYKEGFVFDEGPHISFTKNTRVQDLFAGFVDQQYEVLQAEANNYYQGQWIKHPAQCNLHGLPVDLVTAIISEFASLSTSEDGRFNNYREWLHASFGETFSTKFPERYGLKYHTTPAENMSTDWLGPRLYRPDLKEVVRGALTPETEDVHYISNFRYPTKGGFRSYLDQMPKFANINLSHRLVELSPNDRKLTFANGKKVQYDQLISSLPLPVLISTIKSAPPEVVAAAEKLACTSCVIVNLGVNRENISECHWTYIYDEDICFTRLSYPSMFTLHNAPRGTSSVQVELYFSDKYKPIDRDIEKFIPAVISDLKKCGVLLEDDEILLQDAMLLPYANIIFDLDRHAATSVVHAYLDELSIKYCGRYGEWAYIWTDESFESGERAAMACYER